MITHADQWDTARWYNFKPKEFACSCCNALNISPVVLDFVQAYRNHVAKGVSITSGYRCPKHNSSVSSTGEDGPHTTGFAIDIGTNTQSQYELIRFGLHYSPRAMGIGVAKTFTHIDFLTIDQGEKYVIRPNVWKY
jgi:zinc D-Ala-D-Ala carboxypeptidase